MAIFILLHPLSLEPQGLQNSVIDSQKGQIEKNHELIRYVLPKGTSFDGLTQADVQLLACHINSYTRKKLNDKSPTESFSFLYGDELLHTLGIELVPPHTINLSPSLLKKEGLSDGN